MQDNVTTMTTASGLLLPSHIRYDGYVNVLNKYGTLHDNSTAYEYQNDGPVADTSLASMYEDGGLFAKIIDAPAEEALKHGYDFGLQSPEAEEFITAALEVLDWEETAVQAVKWARLFGGAIGVMLIDDGGGLDEPLNWRAIRGIDEIRVFDRSIATPDYSSVYNYDAGRAQRTRATKFGQPERYNVTSIYGQFWVHESRCLVFRNGVLPERTTKTMYRHWGVPEYLRIRKELRETITSHGFGVKMLERSVQPVYKQRGLADLVGTEDGENEIIKRLQVIDMARGLLNSIAIDAEGEDYDFRTIPFSGVKDIIDTTCNILSAVTNIPQTVLFGRSPAGQNATGQSDLENYYNFIERIQKLQIKGNFNTLINVIVRAGLAQGKLTESPNVALTFNPLWSMSDQEQAAVDSQKAVTAKTKAETAQIYIDMGVLGPADIIKGLAADGDFQIEELLDDYDDDDLEELMSQSQEPDEPESEEPEPDKQSADQLDAVSRFAERKQARQAERQEHLKQVLQADNAKPDKEQVQAPEGAGVLVVKDGKVLAGIRADTNEVCGPGGHIEKGETFWAAAMRETQEEFGVRPLALKLLGQLDNLPQEFGRPYIYLCTEFDGEPKCASPEISSPMWLDPVNHSVGPVTFDNLFPPFAESLKLLTDSALV